MLHAHEEKRTGRKSGEGKLCCVLTVMCSCPSPYQLMTFSRHSIIPQDTRASTPTMIAYCSVTRTQLLHMCYTNIQRHQTLTIQYTASKKTTVLVVHQTKQYIAKERYIILTVLITRKIIQANKKDRYKILKKDTGYQKRQTTNAYHSHSLPSDTGKRTGP